MYKDGKYIGWIYKITNLTNGALYIGQTSQDVQRRFKQHTYGSEGSMIDSAMKEFGHENFKVENIEMISCDTEEEYRDEANRREGYWIAKYNTFNDDFHYNLTPGGDRTSEVRKRPVIAYDTLGNIVGSYETITLACKELGTGINQVVKVLNHPDDYYLASNFYFRDENSPLTTEEKEELRISHPYYYQYDLQGNLIGTFKNVDEVVDYYSNMDIQITKGEIQSCTSKKSHARNGFIHGAIWRRYPDTFETLPLPKFLLKRRVEQRDVLTGEIVNVFKDGVEASKKLNLSCDAINHCCNNYQYSYGGYHWCYEGEFDVERFESNVDKKKNRCAILQFDIYGNLISKYSSLESASNSSGIREHYIWRVCTGRRETANGYIWRFDVDVKDIDSFKEEVEQNNIYKQFYPIYEFSLDGQFIKKYSGARDIKRQIGEINTATVMKRCNDQSYMPYKNKIWRYEKDAKDIQAFKESYLTYLQSIDKTPEQLAQKPQYVIQMTLDGIPLSYYTSYAEAGKANNVCSNQIRDNCLGKQKSCHGFKWILTDDYSKYIKDGGKICTG